jgi:hypothetical protein
MKRSKHSLSNYRLLTCDMGELVPIGVTEVLPGDTFQQRTSALIRVAPMQAPVMHPVSVRIAHFYVPNRLVYEGWEDFITGGKDGTGSSVPYPTISTNAANGSLADYLGVPSTEDNITVSALPFRAYNLIYNEWFKDNDLIDDVSLDSNVVQKCAWEKDYFTTARPWPQKGDSIEVPLVGTAPITGLGILDSQAGSPGNSNTSVVESGSAVPRIYAQSHQTSNSSVQIESDGEKPTVFADLSQGVYADVETIRRGFSLQRYQEARARYGHRFTEYLRYLGIRASDARLQRPELLGSSRGTISFSEVLSTSDAGDQTEVGDLYGHGIAALRGRRYRRFFEEHGHVITVMSVRPKSIYIDALHRKFLRRTKEDYWQKELETLGQQEITEREVYGDSNDTTSIFGYVDRYREYREEWSKVCGEFRDLLNYWHMGRDFSAQPVLNQDFVECNPTKRIHSVQTNDVLYCMINHSIQARRLVRRFAKPGGLS